LIPSKPIYLRFYSYDMIHFGKNSERGKIVAICREKKEGKEKKERTIQKVCPGERLTSLYASYK